MPKTVERDGAARLPGHGEHAREVRRRRLAILTGGLVVGVGGVLVAAAWNDSEFATGTFAAGAFDLEGSTDGAAYDQHATPGDAALLAFTAPFDELAPDDVVTAPFAVRLAAGTTSDATVAISAVDPVPLPPDNDLANLTYTLVQTASFGCGAPALPGGVDTQGPVGSVPGTPTFELVAGTDAATAGAPAFFCFTVTAGADLVQGQSGQATWQFAATSD